MKEQSLHAGLEHITGAERAGAELREEVNELWVSGGSVRPLLGLPPPHTEASVLIQSWQTHCAHSLFLYQLLSLVDAHD